MLRRALVHALILSAALLGPTACGSGAALRGPAGRVVVVHAAGRAADAQALEARLVDAGFRVAVEPAGAIVRERSSAAVYLAAQRPDRVEALRAALPPLDVEVLPFVHAGPPGTDVVVWLARAGAP